MMMILAPCRDLYGKLCAESIVEDKVIMAEVKNWENGSALCPVLATSSSREAQVK